MFESVTTVDFENVRNLVPEMGWSYAQGVLTSVTVRHGNGSSRTVTCRLVSREFFRNLGIEAQVGRVETRNHGPAAILSAEIWKRAYASDPNVVGDAMVIEDARIAQLYGGAQVEIVGVAAAEFSGVFAESPDVWILDPPTSSHSQEIEGATVKVTKGGLFLFSVLSPPTTLTALGTLLAEYQFHNRRAQNDRLEVAPGIDARPDVTRESRKRLVWLVVVVFLLLALAFMALVDFVFADHAARRDQQAVRVMLGATPKDVFVEILGRLFIWMVVINALSLVSLAYIGDAFMSVEPFKSALGVLSWSSMLTGFAVGAALLLSGSIFVCAFVGRFVTKVSMSPNQADVPLGGRWAQTCLLFAAVASLLMVTSVAARYARASGMSFGFEHTDVLMLGAFYPSRTHPNAAQELRNRLMSQPGVQVVARAEMLPLLAESIEPKSRMKVYGEAARHETTFYRNRVGVGFFETVGLAPLAGRTFGDVSSTEVVLSRAAAERLGGDLDTVLGSAIRVGPAAVEKSAVETQVLTVVGVVEDVAYGAFEELPRLVFYTLFPVDASSGGFQDFWLVRGAGVDGMVTALNELSSGLEDVYEIGRPIEIFQGEFVARYSVELALAAALVFAFVLSLTASVDALARQLAMRSREIGVRLALGATAMDIAREYVGPVALNLTLAVTGVCCAVVFTRFFVPDLMEVIELPLVVVSFAALGAVSALAVHVGIRRFSRASSIVSLVNGLTLP